MQAYSAINKKLPRITRTTKRSTAEANTSGPCQTIRRTTNLSTKNYLKIRPYSRPPYRRRQSHIAGRTSGIKNPSQYSKTITLAESLCGSTTGALRLEGNARTSTTSQARSGTSTESASSARIVIVTTANTLRSESILSRFTKRQEPSKKSSTT